MNFSKIYPANLFHNTTHHYKFLYSYAKIVGNAKGMLLWLDYMVCEQNSLFLMKCGRKDGKMSG